MASPVEGAQFRLQHLRVHYRDIERTTAAEKGNEKKRYDIASPSKRNVSAHYPSKPIVPVSSTICELTIGRIGY